MGHVGCKPTNIQSMVDIKMNLGSLQPMAAPQLRRGLHPGFHRHFGNLIHPYPSYDFGNLIHPVSQNRPMEKHVSTTKSHHSEHTSQLSKHSNRPQRFPEPPGWNPAAWSLPPPCFLGNKTWEKERESHVNHGKSNIFGKLPGGFKIWNFSMTFDPWLLKAHIWIGYTILSHGCGIQKGEHHFWPCRGKAEDLGHGLQAQENLMGNWWTWIANVWSLQMSWIRDISS